MSALSICIGVIILKFGTFTQLVINYIRIFYNFSSIDTINSLCEAFQGTAFSASISLMLPKELYDKGNGLMELGDGKLTHLLHFYNSLSRNFSFVISSFVWITTNYNGN